MSTEEDKMKFIKRVTDNLAERVEICLDEGLDDSIETAIAVLLASVLTERSKQVEAERVLCEVAMTHLSPEDSSESGEEWAVTKAFLEVAEMIGDRDEDSLCSACKIVAEQAAKLSEVVSSRASEDLH